jgi:hypothetical protein
VDEKQRVLQCPLYRNVEVMEGSLYEVEASPGVHPAAAAMLFIDA